jgi:hypothetical protein
LVTLAVECKVLSSNPSHTKKKKKRRNEMKLRL